MLVLSRKKDQSIRIGSQASVRVVEVSGNRVKLGVEAHRSIRVLRGELTISAEVVVCEEAVKDDGVDHAKYAAELLYCLQRLLGCTHDPSSEHRVDLRGIPQAWILETYDVMDKYEKAMGVPTIDECLKQISERQGAAT
jgi:carbon storage regulator CsrA